MSEPLKVFVMKFPGHYIGGYAIVVATDRGAAERALHETLKKHGLGNQKLEVEEFKPDKPLVMVLSDGDY